MIPARPAGRARCRPGRRQATGRHRHHDVMRGRRTTRRARCRARSSTGCRGWRSRWSRPPPARRARGSRRGRGPAGAWTSGRGRPAGADELQEVVLEARVGRPGWDRGRPARPASVLVPGQPAVAIEHGVQVAEVEHAPDLGLAQQPAHAPLGPGGRQVERGARQAGVPDRPVGDHLARRAGMWCGGPGCRVDAWRAAPRHHDVPPTPRPKWPEAHVLRGRVPSPRAARVAAGQLRRQRAGLAGERRVTRPRRRRGTAGSDTPTATRRRTAAPLNPAARSWRLATTPNWTAGELAQSHCGPHAESKSPGPRRIRPTVPPRVGRFRPRIATQCAAHRPRRH